MKVIKVNTKEQRQIFLKIPLQIYKDYPLWVQPLNQDIQQIFDEQQNKRFKDGACQRWLLQDEAGYYIGRIAAFYDNETTANIIPVGGIGFFECIDNEQAAFLLFDTCKGWLLSKGMAGIEGPINFGERHQWWGLLTEGYDKLPNYACNYQPPYYKALFENYGFQDYFQQYTYWRKTDHQMHPLIKRQAQRVLNNVDYKLEHLNKKEIKRFAEDFKTIYNEAWSNHDGINVLTLAEVHQFMTQLMPIIDEKIIWFCYHESKPIGFIVHMPDINHIVRKLKGQVNWWGKLVFAWHLWRKTSDKMLGLIFGVVPAYHRKGIAAALAMALHNELQSSNHPYETIEFNWIGDFNPNMLKILETLGASIYKKHTTYRLYFDESIEFKRAKVL